MNVVTFGSSQAPDRAPSAPLACLYTHTKMQFALATPET